MPKLRNRPKEYEYAGALKDAIALRRSGNIDAATDTLLGNIVNGIAQWAIASEVVKGRLWRTFAHDEDFCAHVRLKALQAVDKVDLGREPKEILKFIKRSAERDGIKHYIRDVNRKKRLHTDVQILDCDIAADFYGRKIVDDNKNQEVQDVLCGRDSEGGASLGTANRNQGRTAAGIQDGGSRSRSVLGRAADAARRKLAAARRTAAALGTTAAAAIHPWRKPRGWKPSDGERLFLL